MFHKKNHDQCPDFVPDDLLNGTCPAEITGTGQDGCPLCIVVPTTTRRERRREARAEAKELSGPYLIPANPDDTELDRELGETTLGTDLRPVYRLRSLWLPCGLVDRLRAFCWLRSISQPLDVGYAPGWPLAAR